MNEDQPLNRIFEESLAEGGDVAPEEAPSEWTVGHHRYIRVLAEKNTLEEKLVEFRESGVRVLDFDRVRGFWVFKTRVPS